MKIAINKGLGVPYQVAAQMPKDLQVWDRSDPRLIAALEDYLQKFGDDSLKNEQYNIEIVEIPDEATDWMIIDEYGGGESVIYVLWGKIRFA